MMRRFGWTSRSHVARALAVALLAVAPVSAADNLVTQVTWVGVDGARHRGLFQGRDDDGVLSGHVFEGHDRLAVSGSVDAGGAVTGTLRDRSGQVVGYFLGDVDAAGTLRGAYLREGDEGRLEAPAECLRGGGGDTSEPRCRSGAGR